MTKPLLSTLLCLFAVSVAHSAEPQKVTYRVVGLFSPDREADLKQVMKDLPEVTLVSIDFKTSEATFTFEAAKAFPGAKPDQIMDQFDKRLRTLTRSTFGIKAVCTIPRDKLKFVEIAVVGLDCKACSFAAYEIVARLDGVEQATASFKDGLVTAWIDPAKTDRTKLEAALKQKNVQLKTP